MSTMRISPPQMVAMMNNTIKFIESDEHVDMPHCNGGSLSTDSTPDEVRLAHYGET